ncbi:MAG: sugar ABC transporter ATP-binding protein, partial [Planctomycetota bacterium]
LFELIGRLRRQGRTILYVSHNLGDVLQLSDSIMVLRDGCVVDKGPGSQYTIDKMVTMMVGRDISQLYPPHDCRATSETVLEVNGLTQRGIIKDITFSLRKGEILGLFGLMGSGRTELARILFGIDPYQHGTIARRGQSKKEVSPQQSIKDRIAFVTEDRREEGLLIEGSVRDNMALVALGRYARGGQFVERGRIAASVAEAAKNLKMKVGCLQTQPAKNLSGGNQQKLVIAKWLLTEPEILILDEPTRGIDVGARYEIYCIINELAAAGKAILCICSELEELIGICDRILVMSNGEIQGTFEREEFDQQQILQCAFKGHKAHRQVG